MADRSVDGCLCIRLLTDLDLFTVCTLVSIVHYPLAEAKLNAEKGQKIQDQRKPLCQSSAGEGRKATWSCCAWVCCDHESCSHHPNMTTTCVLPKHRHTVMRQLSVLTGTGLFPLFSSSSAFLLFHIITSSSSTALLAAWEYWALQDLRLKAADSANTDWFFFSFLNNSVKNCSRECSFRILTSQFLILANKSLCPSRPNSKSIRYNKYKKMHYAGNVWLDWSWMFSATKRKSFDMSFLYSP